MTHSVAIEKKKLEWVNTVVEKFCDYDDDKQTINQFFGSVDGNNYRFAIISLFAVKLNFSAEYRILLLHATSE